jgi:membrane protease YdiL (CAAX protease family)
LFGAYHLYQGPLGAAGIFVIGLVFGTYMATKQRFWPLFVAHSAMDLIPHLAYLQGLQDT